jgi:Xaa-Pro dipeptidase
MRQNQLPSRRRFLHTAGVLSSVAFTTNRLPPPQAADTPLPPPFTSLKPLGDRIKPVTADEYRQRLEKAQRLMGDPPTGGTATAPPKLDALFFSAGSSLHYFTGVQWGLSERLLGLILPRTGAPVLIAPGFEEGRAREQLHFPIEVRIWQEDESPTKLAAVALADRGIRSGRIGIEETVGFTFFDHLRQAAPQFEYVSADPVTIACRAHKSAHELELMRLASEATFDVFRATFASLKEGMTQQEVAHQISAGFSRMDLHGGALVLFGASAALPHGSVKPQKLKEGDVVLIDGGCAVEGYQSDVTRTTVLGKPTEKVQRAFDLVRKAQDAALDAARTGRLSGSVDDAARAVIANGGYGPGYKYFTHRLGHGIGLDGHEHPYLVRGSETILEPGMTFSNEPGIYVPGEFGVRCEDDMVIMPEGPAQLLTPGFAPSLEKPFA